MCLRILSWDISFHCELQEAKIWEFLTLNIKSMSVCEYSLMFALLSRYAPDMVVEMRRKISLFVYGLSHNPINVGKKAMLIRDIDIARIMNHVQ